MSLTKKLSRAVLIGSLAGLAGCGNSSASPESTYKTFAEIRVDYSKYLEMRAVDVDGDNDQDLVIGYSERNSKIKFMIFKNDGTGKFYQD